MPKALEVWLIRHGESTSNTGAWSKTPHDVALTEKGKSQAENAATNIVKLPDRLIVSPSKRAQATAEPILARWPTVTQETLPIQEFVYLSPTVYHDKKPEERNQAINTFWETADPLYCDGTDAESFAQLEKRLQDFHQHLLTQTGFIVVVGHAHFFSAYLYALEHGFKINANWIKNFREYEIKHPIANGEIIKLNGDK